MSADVDQEIYDDAVSLAGVKPQIKEKPNVKNIAAMFGGGGAPPVSSKPVVKKSAPGAKPVAVVPPSKTDSESSKVQLRGPKPAVKPLPKLNGDVKKNNNNIMQPRATSPVTGGKIAIPGAFSNDSTSPDVKLTDLRSSLKPVGGINTVPKSSTKETPQNSTPLKKSPVSPPARSPINSSTQSSSSQPTAKSTPVKTDLCILTSDDNCKFRLKPKPRVFGGAPAKPPKLTDVDLKAALKALPPALPKRPIPKTVSVMSDEVYDDVDNTRPVSEIKEYTEQEEAEDISGGQVEPETYDDVGIGPPTPARNQPAKPSLTNSITTVSGGEAYDDCAVAGSDEVEGEMEELYEALDDIQANAVAIKDDKKEKKKKEQEKKEKKEKEKKEREERERLQKIEKEKKKQKDLWTKLKITGNEESIYEGKVRENCKGIKLDLALKKGENVTIIRMTDCPQYKWVAKAQDGRVGFVDIKNIEVMTGTLQSVKEDVQRNAASGEFEEIYDDVATAEDADQDIYEDTM